MAKKLLLLGAVCALMFGAGPLQAQQGRDLVVGQGPNHGVLRVLPEKQGIIYVGTGEAVDSFSFGCADNAGFGSVDVTIDPELELVTFECQDWGGPTVTGFRVTGLRGSSDDKSGTTPSAGTPTERPRKGYTLIIFVDQPGDGGDRDTWEGPIMHPSVGHAFLQIINGDTQQRRTFGFYGTEPFISPLNPSSPGEIRDDTNHVWDVSLEIQITEDQYLDLLEEINDDLMHTPEYDLSDNNCVDWVLGIVQAIGLKLNTSVGEWPLGGGHNPGDLGEDLMDQGGTRFSSN